MRSLAYILLVGCLIAPRLSFAQYAVNGAGDRIESTSYNDHKRGSGRRLNYLPDGDGFVCINGENRYTRALYGGHTAWRLETSDRPIFATYVKGDSRNISFLLELPAGDVIPLEEFDRCESRYIPGCRIYKLTDRRLPGATLTVSVLADMESERGLWRFTANGMPAETRLIGINSHICVPKLSRSGDMGADAPRCFDPSDKADAVVEKIGFTLNVDGDTYIAVSDNKLSQLADATSFDNAENARRSLAGRIEINTPDKFLNPIGGALAVAADGIWGEEEVWLHGAVGWRMPLSGWRAAYTGDCIGWHDRARRHFDNYAASQVRDVPCTIPHPAQDSTLALARSVKKWGTPQYSNGYICRNPQRNNQMHHYDMNLCYIDELLWHLNWTGDLEYARQMWPVLTSHLKWEKLNYDPDDDGLYDAYACIWASDALYYESGAVTHSTAYNYRANRLAAMIAEKIGEDPAPYRREADKILAALNSVLWMDSEGHWAEYREFMGHKRVHSDAAVWTIYHAIDSDVANSFQAYMATRYVDKKIPHIPVAVSDSESGNSAFSNYESLKDEVNSGAYATISTTDWMPYSWSINNVAFAEVMHTALAYFEAGRGNEGYQLMKSSLLDGMYLSESPANFGQISFYDAARGECYRDFGDPIGVASRLLVQGLYGVQPDAINRRLLLKPGFPTSWQYASLNTSDIYFDYKRTDDGVSLYTLTHHLLNVDSVELRLPAVMSVLKSVSVNGKEVDWKLVPQSVEKPVISVVVAAAAGEEQNLKIEWGGTQIADTVLTVVPEGAEVKHFEVMDFALIKQDDMSWWIPVEHVSASDGKDAVKAGLAFNDVNSKKCRTVDMSKYFNSSVTDIFRNRYLTPRSPYTTLQLPVQGIGEWCHPLATAEIDDSGLRAAVTGGIVSTPLGVDFRTPADGDNIAFTSLWDNYPDSLQIVLSGRASHAYLLMAGSTNHMQSRIENGRVMVYYKDGSSDVLSLVNPDNWPPIEQFFFEDGKAFNRDLPSLYRLRLKSGDVSRNFGSELGYTGVNRMVDGGAAVLLDMPLNAKKQLSHLVVSTTAPDVVIGLMAVTLQH
jgi:hypothetical protein